MLRIPLKIFFLLVPILFMNNKIISAQQIPYELDPNKNTTVTYQELVDFYKILVKDRKDAKLIEIGQSDIGKPLQLLILSKDGDFDPRSIKNKGKAVLFMNNGIHPGEPEGMDASIMLVRDLLTQNKLPENLVICLIPVYNIAGMLNRGVSRANQNGPVAYGFRGSEQHYDLNRDFIKGDTKNSLVFQKTFSTWDPDVFFDTHTSNGADYQYVMTLIESQKDKLNSDLSRYMKEKFTNPLYKKMEAHGFPMVPYVDSKGETPASGLVSFLESPRYSTGYAALHNTIGYMPETHMWKSYQQRVESTYLLMQSLIEISDIESKSLVGLRTRIKKSVSDQVDFPVDWILDNNIVDTLLFKGFQAAHKKSEVSGLDRLYYDRNKLFEKEIPYYGTYKPSVIIKKPKAYVLPQSYESIVKLMQINGVQMEQIKKDTVMEVEMYYIDSFQTQKNPYEGHYPHYEVKVTPKLMQRRFFAGDWLIKTNQPINRYIIETLEPQGIDSFFNWNFFDAILSQKEYFSDYIFEDEAAEILNNDKELLAEFETAKIEDPDLKDNARKQLEWVYKKTKYYEDSHLLYPVGRIVK